MIIEALETGKVTMGAAADAGDDERHSRSL